MNKIMKINIVELKNNLQYLDQYIKLRNSYENELFTKPVSYEETKKWLQSDTIFLIVAIKNEILLGAVILYLTKDNEITIFTKESNKGIGTLLLKEIEKTALKNKLKYIYSWVENSNYTSSKLFLKHNFLFINKIIKKHNNIKYIGNIFKKELSR